MPPDQTDEQPPLLQEDCQHHPTEATPRQEASSLAAGSILQLRAREIDYTEEPGSEATAKCPKLFSAYDTPIQEPDTISMEYVQEILGVPNSLQQELEKSQALDAESQQHEATEADLAGSKQDATSRLKDYEAIKLEFAELRDSFDIMRRRHKRLKAKIQGIEAKRSESEDQQRDLEAIKSQLDETRRENSSLKLQAHDRQNALVERQERLNSRDCELLVVQNQLEDANKEVAALRLVLDKNGAYNMNIRDTADRSKKELAKAQQGL